MVHRLLAPLLAAAILVAAVAPGTADAQTRFSLQGGAIVPLGNFGDVAEPSPRFGLRAEFQPVNALGQRRLLAVTLEAGFSALSLEPDYEASLGALGTDEDASLIDLGAGVRAYSRVAPFFVSGGAGWARFRVAGFDAENGVDVHGGLGFLAPLGAVTLEVEAALHQVFLDSDDLQHLTATAAIALPI